MTEPAQVAERGPGRCPLCGGAVPLETTERFGEVLCPQCSKRLWFCRHEAIINFHDAVRIAALRARVVKIVAEKLGADPATIQDSSAFMEDFGADSLDVVELVMSLEEEFKITIPDAEAEKIKTVGDLLDYLATHVR
jgi:acyl carrier protein